VGNVSVANTVLENNSIAPGGDLYNVFGVPSAEASEPAALRTADFVGIAVHCAKLEGTDDGHQEQFVRQRHALLEAAEDLAGS
jgi:hypothetical protein